MTLGPQPRAFVSHASEDTALAEKLGAKLLASGIDAFVDVWDLSPGDSIPAKLNEGIGGCTHFIALISDITIGKPWVTAELEAAYNQRILGNCVWIPVVVGVSPADLPPLFSKLIAVRLDDFDKGAVDLVNAILGVSRKPPLGQPPAITSSAVLGPLRISPAAEVIIRIMVHKSENGRHGDPKIAPADLHSMAKLGLEDFMDAVSELVDERVVHATKVWNARPYGVAHIWPTDLLFARFDKYLTAWDPESDAHRIAAHLVNELSGTGKVADIAQAYGWMPRRMNPALTYLVEHGYAEGAKTMHPTWVSLWIRKNDRTRRFAKETRSPV